MLKFYSFNEATDMPVLSPTDNVKSLLLGAVNSIEKTNLQLSQVDFSLPQINTDTDPLRNTKIRIIFNELSGKSGEKWITYNRVHKSLLPPISITRTTETTIYQLLPIINSTYQFPITENDVEDTVIVGNDLTITIDLQFKPESLIYYQGTEVVTSGSLPIYIKQPANIELSIYCDGTTKMGRYTDGYGGEYLKILELYSSYCGFTGTTPPPITTLTPAPTTSLPPTSSVTPTTTSAPTTTPPPTTTIAPTTTTVPTTTPPPTSTSGGFIVMVNGAAVTHNGEYVLI